MQRGNQAHHRTGERKLTQAGSKIELRGTGVVVQVVESLLHTMSHVGVPVKVLVALLWL